MPTCNPQVDIIIPHFGITQELTDKCLACLRSIREHSASGYRVIFVDNASPDEQLDQVLAELHNHPHVLIRNRVNTGFIKATNSGIALSTAPLVVLLNNDTRVAPLWLEKLAAPLRGNIGVSGPRTTTPNSWQGRVKEVSGTVRILPAGNMLAFFCVMFRSEVLKAVGPLDEDFGMGLGDDDWYCLQVQRKGWQLALVTDLVIAHDHRSTFHTLHTPEEVKAQQAQAMELFHGKVRGEVQ